MRENSTSLEGRTVLITGGGSGLGQAICLNVASHGACVAVADIRPETAEETARALRSDGANALAYCLDVADERSTCHVTESVASRFGRIDALVNCAGVDVTLPLEELSVGDWDRVLGVNLRGPFLMAKHVLPYMRSQGGGSIVNIVSTAAMRSWPNAAAYHASKRGLLGLSHALHAELRPHGIKVTAVVAGGMRTPFLLDRFPDIDVTKLQEPGAVAETVRFVLCQPPGIVIPEVMVLPMKETSWP